METPEVTTQQTQTQTETKKKLTPVQSLDILIQAVRLAQTKGAYSLEEAALLFEAIDVFKQTAPTAAPVDVPKVD
jgi:hypothetical protein